MIELPLPYLKELASQIIFISAFLGGFSASILGTLILSRREDKILKVLISGSSISSISFIVAVFAMTKLVMLSIPGYPSEVGVEQTIIPRAVGGIAFFIGLLSLMFVVSASGWLHSRRLGITTTSIGLLGLILILLSM